MPPSLFSKEREKPLFLGERMESTLGSYLDPWEYKSNISRGERVPCVWAFMT